MKSRRKSKRRGVCKHQWAINRKTSATPDPLPCTWCGATLTLEACRSNPVLGRDAVIGAVTAGRAVCAARIRHWLKRGGVTIKFSCAELPLAHDWVRPHPSDDRLRCARCDASVSRDWFEARPGAVDNVARALGRRGVPNAAEVLHEWMCGMPS